KLFMAALIPGILAALGYVITISIYVRLNPDAAGMRERRPYRERLRALADVWPVVLIFAVVIGGIYGGIFTPTEAAAIGAAGTGIVALLNGGLSRHNFVEGILATASATAMMFLIV